MGISAGQFLRELVRWQWFIHLAFSGYSWMVYDIVAWYKLLPDPTTQQTFLVTTVTGLAPLVFNFYVTAIQRIPAPTEEPR